MLHMFEVVLVTCECALLRLALHDYNNEKEHMENKKFMKTVLQQIDYLWKILMDNEIGLAEYFEDMHAMLCADLPQLIDNFCVKLKKVINKLLKLNDDFKVQMTAYYSEWCEKYLDDKMLIIKTAGSDVGGLSHEQIDVLKMDWPSVKQFIDEGFELVKTKLNQREESVMSELNTWMNNLMMETHFSGIERHRQRIIEIVHYCETAKEELNFVCKLVKLV